MIEVALWGTVAVLVVLVLRFGAKELSKGLARDLSQLRYTFKELPRVPVAGGYFLIDHRGSDVFLQYEIYHLQGPNGLRLALPRTGWAAGHWDDIRQMAEADGLAVDIEQGSDGLDFAMVDFGSDCEAAFRLAARVFRELLGHGSDERYHILIQPS